MQYFLDQSYEESYSPEHTYTFTGPCILSGQQVSVTVKAKDLFNYHQGTLIQDAFPYLTPDEREWMMTGMYSL